MGWIDIDSSFVGWEGFWAGGFDGAELRCRWAATSHGADENGLAECITLPHPSTFLTAREGLTTIETENSPIVQLFTCRSVDIHNESQYMLNHIGETPIWYKDVAVYYGVGKTVHQFCDMVSPNGVRNEWQENNPCHSYNDLTDLRHAFSQGIVEIARTEYERTNYLATLFLVIKALASRCGREWRRKEPMPYSRPLATKICTGWHQSLRLTQIGH